MLDFGYNNLTGTIPDDIGNSSSITSLILQHNQIGGKIPPSLGASPSLSVLILNNNRIDGQIPCPLHFLQPQRKPANCNAFCKTFSFAGQCGGQGTCIPKSSVSQRLMRNVTCACNEGYLPDPKDPFACREEGELLEQKEDVLRKEALWRAEAAGESGGEAEVRGGAEEEGREETVRGGDYQGEGEEEEGEGQWVSVGDLAEQEAETGGAEGGDEVSVGEWGEVQVGRRAGEGRGTGEAGGAGGAGGAAEGRVDRMLRGSWGGGRAGGESGRRWGEGVDWGQGGDARSGGMWRKRYSNTRYDRYDAFP
ncbi:unnamed protein product [Closterium sp. NIES-65]|nr:unnamed protein product [Closterium sp. NIES-65]